MKLKQCKTCSKSVCRWRAEAKIYREMKNPVWDLNCTFAGKLISRSKVLPMSELGIPGVYDSSFSGCVLFNSTDLKLQVCDGVILLYHDNVIELKHDKDGVIENAILNSAPNDIYKEIQGFL